jgi:UDPglucose 6-dehydrogenase
MKLKIGIAGVGMVGTPLRRYLEEVKNYKREEDLFLYDIDPKKGYFDDISKADVIFISVPTPRSPDGSANLTAVDSVFHMLKDGKIVVLKSTIPPGTTEYFQKKFPQHKVLFNPENLTERMAWEDFIRPDVQIVGFTEKSKDAAGIVLSILPGAPLMSPWGFGTYHKIQITATEAEIIKYARNVFFARKVNFANLLAKLSEKFGADYGNVRRGMSADFRVGSSHLDVEHNSYRGFGGFCLPKDLDALISSMDSFGLQEYSELLKRDREFNKKILAEQGLTPEDVSVHDSEWIDKKMKSQKGA